MNNVNVADMGRPRLIWEFLSVASIIMVKVSVMHYSQGDNDFMPFQIAGDWTVSPAACSGNHNSSALLALCDGNPSVIGGFPSQRANNGESVSIPL